MNPQGLGTNTSDFRIERLDERWSAVRWITRPALQCVLRRRPDQGIDLLRCGWSFGAIAVREGRVPAPRYRGAARWKRGMTGRWLVFVTRYGNGAGVLALDRDEDEPWTWDDRRLARAMRSSTTPLADQLTECGYEPIARSSDGEFEVRANSRFPGLPLIAGDPERWCLLRRGSALWQWDSVTVVPDDAPGADVRRVWAPDVGEWRIPAGPLGLYRGALDDLRAFHPWSDNPSDSDKGAYLGKFHRWGHPSAHFHLDGTLMVATEEDCTETDRKNRDWRGNLEEYKWRMYGDHENGCGVD